MARKSKKAELRKQELISNVPAEQRKMVLQPITFAYLNGEMSVMHARIQTIIMEKLQIRLAKALKSKSENGYSGDLFHTDDFAPLKGEQSGSYLTFSVKYSELGIEPSNYRYVSDAARAMQGSLIYEKEVDGYVRSIVVFPVIDVPDETKGERRTDIKLHMTESTARDLFRITPYHRYLKDAIFLFSSGYTGRIYLLINANKQLKTWSIEYEKLRKILLTTYDKEKKKYVADKYKDISDFKKRVLEPARKEIAEAASHIDCTFDYEFRYPAGKKRGTPEFVVFHIHLTDLGRNINRTQIESQESAELRNILVSLHLSIVDVNRLMKMMPVDKYSMLSAKAMELKRLLAEVKAGNKPELDIRDPRAYALTSLKNFIVDKTATQAEEVHNVPDPVCNDPDVTYNDQELW